jgi:hypothetical protein
MEEYFTISAGDLLNAHAGLSVLRVSAAELRSYRVLAHDDVVAVQNDKGFILREGARFQNGVAQPLCLFLAQKKDIRQARDGAHVLQHLFLAGFRKAGLQLGGAVEMVFHDALAAAGDDEDLLDAGGDGLLHDVLDGRLVHNGEHLLGHGLCGGQHAGAQACRGDDGFTDLLHGKHSPLIVSFLQPYRAGKT